MLEELGMTPEEFQKGFSDFISNRKSEKMETGTPLDIIFKDGIPQDKITMVVGEPNVRNFKRLYIEHLVNTKQK